MYLGYRPIVTVADLEMLKEVFIKQFNSLPNREVRTAFVLYLMFGGAPVYSGEGLPALGVLCIMISSILFT